MKTVKLHLSSSVTAGICYVKSLKMSKTSIADFQVVKTPWLRYVPDLTVYVRIRRVWPSHSGYDIGYLYVNQLYDSSIANPPNYGRYANTVYRRNVSTHSNNCMFDVSQDGNNIVWIVATCDIAANQEILVDYSGLEVK